MTPIDQLINDALKKGCILQARTDTTVTLLEPKKFSALGCTLLGFLPYILWYGLVVRDKTWYVQMRSDGTTLWNGMTMEEVKRKQSNANMGYAIGVLIVLGLCAWVCFSGGGQ